MKLNLEQFEDRCTPSVSYVFYDAADNVLRAGVGGASLEVGESGGNLTIDGADTDVPVADVDHATADGDGDMDTLTVSGGRTWTIGAANAGSVSAPYPLVFTSIENLAGTGGDTFQFNSNASSIFGALTTADGLLDYTGRTNAVTVNLANGTASATGGIVGFMRATGGSGNDTLVGDSAANVLIGAAGNDILIGKGGNDTLAGGEGRDILLGGAGNDVLQGGEGDDVLVGGTTNYDSNLSALAAIQLEWTRNISYADRVAHIFGSLGGGLNGNFKLNGSTVQNDGAADVLTGGSGSDWFIISTGDAVTDQAFGEVKTVI